MNDRQLPPGVVMNRTHNLQIWYKPNDDMSYDKLYVRLVNLSMNGEHPELAVYDCPTGKITPLPRRQQFVKYFDSEIQKQIREFLAAHPR